MSKPATVTQIDCDLAEDSRTVMLHGWTDDDRLFIQSFTLPAPID